MANKLDLSRPLFMGPTAARENTTVDHIRRAVAALDTDGTGVTYPQLEEYMLRNYTPAKSANYSGSFVKSYVRDAVNKYGYLTYDNAGHEYAVEAGPKPKAPKAKRVTNKQKEILSVLQFIRDAGEVADAHDVDNTNITPEDVAQELGKRKTWVEPRLTAACEQGLARLEDEGGRTLVYLTPAGFAAVNANDPDGAASAPGADEGEPDTKE